MLAPLLIRADASARIGSGHVMRCLALAQSWMQQGGRVVFAQAESTPALDQRLDQAGFPRERVKAVAGSPEDAAQTVALARSHEAGWIIGDSYFFGAPWQRGIKAGGARLLLWDDYGHAEEYCADLVLNQNLGAQESLYSRRAPGTRLLLGPRYVQLRQEFLAWRPWQRTIPPVAAKVLVTLGGTDPDNVTAKVLAALQALPKLEAVVVVGGSNPHRQSLEAMVGARSSEVRLVVDAANMPELMAWADVAVAAGGSTSWELAFMGLPAVVLVLADNQRDIARVLAEQQLAVNLGEHTAVDAARITRALDELARDSGARQAMSQRARALVDGRGFERLARALRGEE